MKKILFTLLTLACSMTGVKAQQAFAANTGDTEMNSILKEIDTDAKADLNAFSSNIATKFNITKSKIDQVTKIMNPGDVFMSAQVASITKKPFEEVTTAFQANKDKGWGEIAKQMGIKPGSAEFHELKKSMKSNGNSKGKGNSAGNNGGKGKGNSKGNARGAGNNNERGNNNGTGNVNSGNDQKTNSSGSGTGNVNSGNDQKTNSSGSGTGNVNSGNDQKTNSSGSGTGNVNGGIDQKTNNSGSGTGNVNGGNDQKTNSSGSGTGNIKDNSVKPKGKKK